MGYTHYYSAAGNDGLKAPHGWNNKNGIALNAAIQDMAKVIQSTEDILADLNGGGKPHIDRDTAGIVRVISFNGKGDLSHEAFTIGDSWNGNWECCKTARKPYDKVVVACLCILGHHLGDAVRISSDGDASDWKEGLQLARTVIPDCKIPATINGADAVVEEPEVVYPHRKIEF